MRTLAIVMAILTDKQWFQEVSFTMQSAEEGVSK